MQIDILRHDSREWCGANDTIRAMTRRELSVSGVCHASWKIWTLADIRATLTNQELALVVTWLRCSERRNPKQQCRTKIIIAVCGHPELYDTSSYFYRNRNKRILLERKWVNMILLWSKALCIKCRSIWKHVMKITEPALLTRCAWQSHAIYRAGLIFVCLLITK